MVHLITGCRTRPPHLRTNTPDVFPPWPTSPYHCAYTMHASRVAQYLTMHGKCLPFTGDNPYLLKRAPSQHSAVLAWGPVGAPTTSFDTLLSLCVCRLQHAQQRPLIFDSLPGVLRTATDRQTDAVSVAQGGAALYHSRSRVVTVSDRGAFIVVWCSVVLCSSVQYEYSIRTVIRLLEYEPMKKKNFAF